MTDPKQTDPRVNASPPPRSDASSGSRAIALRPLLRIARGHALRHPVQSALMVLGVALGVAVVIAIDLANGSALAAFRSSTEAVTGRATHRIVGGIDGVDERVYAALRTNPDPAIVEIARRTAPVVEGTVLVAELEDRPLTLLGVDPFAEPPFRGFFGEGLQAGGALDSFLTRRGALLLGEEVALGAGLEVGDALTLDVGGRQVEATVSGLLAPEDGLARRALGGLLLADVSTAQELLGRTGRLDRIDVLLPPEDSAEGAAMLARLADALPAEVELVPASEQQATVASMTEAFRLNLTALSLLALLVGTFLIFNTVRFGVVQRRVTIATLRSLGVTRREIFAAILVETALLAFVGALFGVLLGIVLGRGAVALVTQTINDLYFVVQVRGVTLQPWSLARGALAGVASAVVAALLPAWEATSVPPVTALRRSTLEDRARANVGRSLLVALLCGLGGVALLAVPSRNIVLGFAALGVVIFAFALAAPAVTMGLMAAATPITGRLFGLVGRMAPRDVQRALSRTAVAIAALMVAVCVSIGVSVMVGSFRITVERWLESTLGADVFMSPASVTTTRIDQRLDPAIVDALGVLPEVAGTSTAHPVRLRSPELGLLDVVAIGEDIAGSNRPYLDTAMPVEELWSAVAAGATIVSEPFFRRHGLGVGDTLTLLADDGPRDFEIVGVFYDYGNERGTAFLADDVYRAGWADEAVTSIALRLEPGVDADAYATELSAQLAAGRLSDGTVVANDVPITVRSNRGLRAEVLLIFDRAFAITGALQVLAILVAFVGVLSALMALQLERARENATLRATGMTRRQLGGLSLLQTGLMGGVAGLLSWPAGLTLALILIYVINRRSFGWTIQTHLSPDVFLRALALAVVAALLAGLYPTWRLSKMPIASSLREE
jgi:putative ABC transport system permease protein